MKLSARNVLKGKVVEIIPGAVNSEVTVEVAPGVKITAVVTRQSAENLQLTPGKEVYAVIKASSVMLAVD